MTMLRRNVESLGRSYRPSFRRYSVVVGSELHLRGAKEAPRSVFHREMSPSTPNVGRYHVFSFSTLSRGDELKPVIAASVSQVLEVASSKARQVSSKAPQPASLSFSSPMEAAEAARAMLALTSPTKSLAEAILNDKAPADQVACLHQAFIQVTSWCISLVPSDNSLITYALNLARRAGVLSLPLHLFLYRSLVTAIARHSKEEDPTSDILEASALAVLALNIPLSASFFSDALVAFVERNQLQKAIDLQGIMNERYDIDMLDGLTAMAVLRALQQAVLQDPSRQLIDGSTAGMLLTKLSGPLIQSVDSAEVESLRQSLEDSIEALMGGEQDEEAQSEDEYEDDYDDYDDSGDEIDEYYDEDQDDVYEEMIEHLDTCTKENSRKGNSSRNEVVEELKTMQAAWGEVAKTLKEEGVIIDYSLPPIPEFPFDDKPDDFTREMIYLRDFTSNTWMLPDVTGQLVQLIDGEDACYTREYEEAIMKQIYDEEPIMTMRFDLRKDDY